MKREINCRACAEVWVHIANTPDPEAVAAGELLTIVRGTALNNYRCDGCNKPIALGEVCHAVGVVTGAEPAPSGWECEFVDVEVSA